MEKKKKILELRARLDKALASPDLANIKSIGSLVKNQLLRSGLEGNIDLIVEKRANEVLNFLQMLRSASGNEEAIQKSNSKIQNDWKLKQDTDDLRVMYREGPQGTPFHTLLTEGFADGPLDVCLCVAWESTLYNNWWPQFTFPTFKIIMSERLKKVLIGEEISLIRVKVPWPVSDREALLHYFEIEYIEQDLVLVLLNTISDDEEIDINSHGFTREGIPKADGMVRIDLIGGFVMQKVNDQRTYFRMIANMDIKLDFVPPSLINFITRQLIGNGYKLYQKAVSTVATSDEDYKKALQEPIYVQIRDSLETLNNSAPNLITNANKKPTPVINTTSVTEIVEEESEIDNRITNYYKKKNLNGERNYTSPEVDNALNILDNAIAVLRQNRASSSKTQEKFEDLNTISEANYSVSTSENRTLPLVGGNLDNNLSNGQQNGYPSAKDSRQQNGEYSTLLHKEKPLKNRDRKRDGSSSRNRDNKTESDVTAAWPMASERTRKVGDEGTLKANGFNVKGKSRKSRKKNRMLCCISLGNVTTD